MEFQSQNVQIWIRLPRHNWPTSWSDIEDPVVPLVRLRLNATFSLACH